MFKKIMNFFVFIADKKIVTLETITPSQPSSFVFHKKVLINIIIFINKFRSAVESVL